LEITFLGKNFIVKKFLEKKFPWKKIPWNAIPWKKNSLLGRIAEVWTKLFFAIKNHVYNNIILI
jgi:hypothetical protein